MIEIVDADRCIGCDKCIDVCPTRVFDRGPDGVPVIARQPRCQTCFQCEAYCPVDALFVAPLVHPAPADSPFTDLDAVERAGMLGGYRAVLGLGRGRSPGARVAVQPQAPQ